MSHDLQLARLLDRLDFFFSEDNCENEPKKTALIGLEFCILLEESLDQPQREGMRAARDFWFNDDVNSHKKWVDIFSKRIDADQKNGASKRTASLNRLVWTALNVNTDLSAYVSDFLVGIGSDAGLSAEEMSAVFSKHLPGF